MALNHVTLEDKYDLGKSRIFVTGFQALVRLCLMQKERDRRAGLKFRRHLQARRRAGADGG
jgi:indolepyruvate ferredoxin oxidoreductase